MKFNPLYFKDRLKIINSRGLAGILTLWAHPQKMEERIKRNHPSLFTNDSNLVTITSLYGNGLPQMLANLAYNPQIYRIGVIGNDTIAVPSYTFLRNFLDEGVVEEEIGGVVMARIRRTSFYIDPQLRPEMYSHLEIERFRDIRELANFIAEAKPRASKESDRIEIELSRPEFRDFPSDITSHNISAETPLEAWMEVMYHIDRFGQNIELPKGLRRALFNLDVNIENPGFEPEERLKKFGFDPGELRAYQKDMLSPDLPDSVTYSYGHRLRAYWGLDALVKIAERLRSDTLDRHCHISLWDTKKDLSSKKGDSSSPCFTDAYFVKHPDGKLMMTSGFRTHNAVSAWLTNLYGLRAIQEFVAEKANIEPGQLNVRSRWIGIDPENSKTTAALALVNENRNIRLNLNDPKGHYEITPDTLTNEIVVLHYNSKGVLLEEIRRERAEDIKAEIRQRGGFSTFDHAVWFGMRLEKAGRELEDK